jgi:hypothetical protein
MKIRANMRLSSVCRRFATIRRSHVCDFPANVHLDLGISAYAVSARILRTASRGKFVRNTPTHPEASRATGLAAESPACHRAAADLRKRSQWSDTRPEIHSLNAQQRIAQLTTDSAREQRLPQMDFSGFWLYQGSLFNDGIPAYTYE